MTDMEKAAFAKTYIEKLANGINPLTDEILPDTDIVNNVKIARCLFYVADTLRQVVENGGIHPCKAKSVKSPFYLDAEARKAFAYSAASIPISEITRRINTLVDAESMNKLNYKHILDWLIDIGFLKIDSDPMGKTMRYPTNKGLALGITVEQRCSQRGPYTVVVYNQEAQMFILDNLDAILEWSRR